MFISNNYTAFHLRPKSNLFLLFTSLLSTPNVKQSCYFWRISYFSKIRNRPNVLTIRLQWKVQESSHQERQFTCNSFALNFGQKCVKGLKVTKIVKRFCFKAVKSKKVISKKNCFQREPWREYLKRNFKLHVK